MGDHIRYYLGELAKIDMEGRQRLDEAPPLIPLAAMAAPWILQFLGPMLARRGLMWGSRKIGSSLPQLIRVIGSKYPQAATKLGLGNPEVRELAIKTAQMTGKSIRKIGTASAWKLKTLPIAASRYYAGWIAGGHAADVVDSITDLDDDPEAQEIYRDFSSGGSKNNEHDIRSLVTQYGFSDHLASKFIRFLKNSGLLSGTDAANRELAAIMAEFKRYPDEYLSFIKNL